MVIGSNRSFEVNVFGSGGVIVMFFGLRDLVLLKFGGYFIFFVFCKVFWFLFLVRVVFVIYKILVILVLVVCCDRILIVVCIVFFKDLWWIIVVCCICRMVNWLVIRLDLIWVCCFWMVWFRFVICWGLIVEFGLKWNCVFMFCCYFIKWFVNVGLNFGMFRIVWWLIFVVVLMLKDFSMVFLVVLILGMEVCLILNLFKNCFSVFWWWLLKSVW